MKKVILFLFSLVFIMVSCKKEKEKLFDSPSLIYYNDFVPDTVMTVHYGDSMSYFLDVNNDSIYDIQFFLDCRLIMFAHQYTPEYYKSVKGINGTELIVEPGYCNGPCSPPVDSGIYINVNRSSTSHVTIEAHEALWYHCHCFSSKNYMGIKLTKNSNIYLGWMRISTDQYTLSIDDYAMTLYPMDSIQVGSH